MKLKLASRSQESVSDLNEEDRQRIEEIKAELLLSAEKSGLAKVRKRNSCSGDFMCLPFQHTVMNYIPLMFLKTGG